MKLGFLVIILLLTLAASVPGRGADVRLLYSGSHGHMHTRGHRAADAITSSDMSNETLALYEVKIAELEAANSELVQLIDVMKACRNEVVNLVTCEAKLNTCQDELNSTQTALEQCQNDPANGVPVDQACSGIADVGALRLAIQASANASEEPTPITLCPNTTIRLVDETDEITFTHKAVAISCEVPRTCTFDGGNATRIFNIEGSTVSFEGIHFQNGSSPHMGGALRFYYSDAEISDCHFYKNSAQYGGAIESSFSNVAITSSLLLENSADEGGAIDAWYSQLEIANDTAFIGNKADDVAAALYLYETTVALSATKFSSSTLKNPAGKGADIYISDDLDPTSGGSDVICSATSPVVFCNGLDESRIYEKREDGANNNTDCHAVGTIHGSSCPIT